MAKEAQSKRSPYQVPPPPAWPAWAALAGVAVVLALTLLNASRAKAEREELEARLANFEATLSQLGTRVDQAAKAAQPRRTGPDPERVYQVKTAGAPSKGRVGAPIVIAEFSDFQ